MKQRDDLVKGVIRQEDIMPNNTVLSTRLANAQFSYNESVN